MKKAIVTVRAYLLRVCALCLALFSYFFLPGVHEWFQQGMRYLERHDLEGLRQFILAFGIGAPVVSVFLMALQSIIPLVPGIIITVANAWIFGWQYGAVYSWVGALLGAILDFGIARWYGRPAVAFFVTQKFLAMTDDFFEKYGVMFVLISRLTPIMPFKIISYGAGLTTIPIIQYLIATAVGQTPAIILYSFIGCNMMHNVRLALFVTSLFTALGVLFYCYWDKLEKCFFSNKN